MKHTVKKKLKSNEGASLMVALLFFVMCATVGSIILAAATASSGRLANLKKEEQTYYSLSSAAKLFSELMMREESAVIIQIDEGHKKVTKNEGYEVVKVDEFYFVDPSKISETDDYKIEENYPLMISILSLFQEYQTGQLHYSSKFPAVSYNENFITPKSDYQTSPVVIEVGSDEKFSVLANVSLNKSLCLRVVFNPYLETGNLSNKSVTLQLQLVKSGNQILV